MKYLITLFAAVAIAATSFAQTPTPTFSPAPEAVVTPSPTATIGIPPNAAQGVGVPVNRHFVVNAAQLAAISGTTSGNFLLTTLPANSVVLDTTVKHFTPVSGGAISAATARVTTTNNNYGTAFNVFQAAGATVYDFYATPKSENVLTATPVQLSITTTGANMSVITAGIIDVWITYYTRS